eukprot:TRINITY_DN175_c0_g1_i1.p1 TRINITY_DN175_c0_g1~~TRINITY_DN175_c0_g1_i1.p1  ORF type:complete len:205 (-),score=29.10 TRINITY_DN175_c0_g1_i1:751-1365(-)
MAGNGGTSLALLWAPLLLLVGLSEAKNNSMEVVKGLNVEKYMGLWYEIARLPNFFESNRDFNVTAQYSLNANGTFNVVNTEFTSTDKKNSITGLGFKKDNASDEAKFKVRFKVPTFFPIFTVYGDYWVLKVDEQTYQWSLVGEPSQHYLWILARTRTISSSLYSDLVQFAKSQGYSNLSRLRFTPQPLSQASAQYPERTFIKSA